MRGHDAQGHGVVVDLATLGLQLDSMILRVFSNLNDYIILKDRQNRSKVEPKA